MDHDKTPGSGLVLFSGGLDSILAVRLLQEQGLVVQAVHFTCPFYSSEWARKSAKSMGIKLHEIPVDDEYFRMVASPPSGYGANMNPCLDCKAYMLRRAETLRKGLDLDFLATGEVVGERPFSQTKPSLLRIEGLSGLEGKIVRPLSGRLLPPTEAEKAGLIKRSALHSISGRSRKPQAALARELEVREYPHPAGGCLLTDPEYSRRLREHLEQEGYVNWHMGELLRLGRHFRSRGAKIVVGRDKEDNDAILAIAERCGYPWLEVKGHPGPIVAIAQANPSLAVRRDAARLAVRYSDSPEGDAADVSYASPNIMTEIRSKPMGVEKTRELMV